MSEASIKKQSPKPENTAINREVGLEQYENDKKIYTEVLEYFAKSNRNRLRELYDAIDAGDVKLAHRKAHSLRGAAGTIGAARLSDAAFIVEKALAFVSGDAMNFATEEKFIEQMLLLEREFNEVFDELGVFDWVKKEGQVRPELLDREKTIELLNKLAPFLEAGDTGCLEYLHEIEQVFRPVAESFGLFITQMENYDFKKAYETMNCIKRFMI